MSRASSGRTWPARWSWRLHDWIGARITLSSGEVALAARMPSPDAAQGALTRPACRAGRDQAADMVGDPRNGPELFHVDVVEAELESELLLEEEKHVHESERIHHAALEEIGIGRGHRQSELVLEQPLHPIEQ